MLNLRSLSEILGLLAAETVYTDTHRVELASCDLNILYIML